MDIEFFLLPFFFAEHPDLIPYNAGLFLASFTVDALIAWACITCILVFASLFDEPPPRRSVCSTVQDHPASYTPPPEPDEHFYRTEARRLAAKADFEMARAEHDLTVSFLENERRK